MKNEISFGQPNQWVAEQMTGESPVKSDAKPAKRLTGPAAFLAVPLLMAACSSGSTTETTRPTIGPTMSPSPIVEQSAMPSPTLEPTPTLVVPSGITNVTPTPEATATPKPLTLKDIVEGKHTAITAKTVLSDVNNLYKENSQAITIYPYGVANATVCENGDPKIPNFSDRLINRGDMCRILVANLIKVYNQTKDNNAYLAAKDAYNYTISSNGMGAAYKTQLDAYLKQVGLM